MTEINTLPVQILGFPNFQICDTIYGSGLSYPDCFTLANSLPRTTIPVPYTTGGNGQLGLPMRISQRNCYLTIEASGGSPDSSHWIPPSDLRALALSVVVSCVRDSGRGGFATYNFQNVASWSILPDAVASRPSDAAQFLTVTVRGAGSKTFHPGAYDPEIALALAAFSSSSLPSRTEPSRANGMDAGYWVSQAEQMKRGGTTAWWTQFSNQVPSEMNYQCDTALGSPSAVDCSQVEWSQLGSTNPPSDTVTIGPDVLFLHSNTCYLAISAPSSIVLQWQQIRTAVATLMNICVQHPFQASQGGRAYSNVPAKVKNKQRRDLTGMNALPSGVNMTIFEQQEAWTNPTAELTTCTWLAVAKGAAVSTCHT